ncbi:secreted RxLR effector protein 161-like [Nicotiana tabacum]|uniref:Secreted RxLR effector protein 161-like n=1 Tax=Nicotiana tabacum TaxID=4097 RepID=A0AC58SJH6_TOBAC
MLEDACQYQKLIGKLLYLTMSRPDIAFSVQTLSQFMQQPKKSHWDAAIRVVKYIKRELGLGILLSSQSSNEINVFCDADWASCPNTRKSVLRYLIKYGESPVSWKSKKQNTVSKSSVEDEYRSMASAVSEVVWLTALLKELGTEVKLPIHVHSDSKAAMQIYISKSSVSRKNKTHRDRLSFY